MLCFILSVLHNAHAVCLSLEAMQRILHAQMRYLLPHLVLQVVPQPGDAFVVLASDGLWDVMSDQDAVDCCNKYNVVLLTTGVRHFKH